MSASVRLSTRIKHFRKNKGGGGIKGGGEGGHLGRAEGEEKKEKEKKRK